MQAVDVNSKVDVESHISDAYQVNLGRFSKKILQNLTVLEGFEQV